MSFNFPQSQPDNNLDQSSQQALLHQTTPSQTIKLADISQTQKDHITNDLFSSTDNFSRLKRAWVREVGTPVIQTYPEDIINHARQWVDSRQLEVDSADDGSNTNKVLMQLEIDRVTYVMVDLLRQRLKKIEQSAPFYHKNHEMKARLSPQEEAFLQGFLNIMGKLVFNSFVKDLPRGVWNKELLVVEPPLDNALITMVATKDVNNIMYANRTVNLARGSLIAGDYKSFHALLDSDAFEIV